MSLARQNASRLPGIYKLTPAERLTEICRLMEWPADFLDEYSGTAGLSIELADLMVENCIGLFSLPIGLAANFIINGQPVVIPMAVEEPSIIAGVSKAALLIAQAGGFSTVIQPSLMMGQIQILDVGDFDRALSEIKKKRAELVALANSYCPNLVARGGGCSEISARVLPAEGSDPCDRALLVVEFLVDCRDAMGANIVNTIAEKIAPTIAAVSNGRVALRILSNLCDRRLAKASCSIPYRLLAEDSAGDFGRNSALKIAQSFSFAKRDPYRACTHNKGIMNGIDAVALATGNDWRSLEAAAHAYAAKDGRYTSLTHCRLDDDAGLLHLHIELPLACGVIGGSTKAHPAVKKSLAILGSFGKTAQGLAAVLASVGLAQNFAAVLALSSEGIQKGHMKLHAKKSRAHL